MTQEEQALFDQVSAERDTLKTERDSLTAERDKIKQEYEEKFGKENPGETQYQKDEKAVFDYFKSKF